MFLFSFDIIVGVILVPVIKQVSPLKSQFLRYDIIEYIGICPSTAFTCSATRYQRKDKDRRIAYVPTI